MRQISKHFARIDTTDWRRSGTDTAPKDESRPHIVGTTPEGRSIIGKVKGAAALCLCAGLVSLNGQWQTGWRFISLPESEEAPLGARLDELVAHGGDTDAAIAAR